MDYLLSDKQSDKAFLYKISLVLSETTSPPSDTISFTITQLDKGCLVMEGLFITTISAQIKSP